MNKKTLIILSGGMDSTTLLYDIVNKYGNNNVLAISFLYGSKHNPIELSFAKQTCEKLGVEHKLINVQTVFDNFSSALLNHKNSEEIPQGHYADSNMKKTVVPFRNGILLSMAVGFAESNGISNVYYGAHAGDHDIYPDCRIKFIKAIDKASKLGTYNKVRIKAPYRKINKYDIIKKGIKLNVDYSKTWTCYNPTKDGQPCGKCGSCVERTEAFYKNKLQDPLYNVVGWRKAVEYMLKVTKKVIK